jgi:3-oxoacyl-[acyl-carrier-protein] synthase-1/3-oxoacyl-[acyl-carrier-protein] synthase II
MGIVSPVGVGVPATLAAIQEAKCGIQPLTLFSSAIEPVLPVGQVRADLETDDLPRTHRLALIAAKEALNGAAGMPQVIVFGVTTGGMLTTEERLLAGIRDPGQFSLHSVGSVAETLAQQLDLAGPAFTLSTACSSGTVAINVACELLKCGRVQRALAGGADSLCRLTYYGFNALQLIDPMGARPMDKTRNGMSVAEGAAVLLLEAHEHVPENAVAEVLGGGLSCDAYHPAAPHPEGDGGLAAMEAALRSSGIDSGEIDYINLHGTGTFHNDLSEARAVRRLFENAPPILSSVKGTFGHSLAAAGAIEAVIAALCIRSGWIPGNVGCRHPDPDLGLTPAVKPTRADVRRVLSNSFGFGGNNAAVVLGRPAIQRPETAETPGAYLSIAGSACISGAGDTEQTLKALESKRSCRGKAPLNQITQLLSPNVLRRLQRLPRMVLSLAVASHEDAGLDRPPGSVFFGTGWGPLSETNDFIQNMLQGEEAFASPTSFVGSVQNAPAGQVAMHFGSTGANITAAGGDYSFEQALTVAALLAPEIDAEQPLVVIGADEYQDPLSDLFDASVRAEPTKSDGGGALCVRKVRSDSPGRIRAAFFETAGQPGQTIAALVDRLGGVAHFNEAFGLMMVGIPLAFKDAGRRQFQNLLSLTGFTGPVIDYRRWLGEYASATAVAVVLAVRFLRSGRLPEGMLGPSAVDLQNKRALIVGLGHCVTAIEICQ